MSRGAKTLFWRLLESTGPVFGRLQDLHKSIFYPAPSEEASLVADSKSFRNDHLNFFAQPLCLHSLALLGKKSTTLFKVVS